MQLLEHIIKTESVIDLRKTVLSHGWVNLAPWYWDNDELILRRPEKFSSGKTGCIELTQKKSNELFVKLDGVSKIARISEVDALVRRWLSLDWDHRPAVLVSKKLSLKVSRFIDEGGGRFLRGSTFYEDFVKTVCTLNASWSFTKAIIGRIVDEIGNGIFPDPITVLDAGHDFFKNKIRLGYRTKILIQSTERLLKEGLIDEKGAGAKNLIDYSTLIDFWGIGPYAAGHLMILLNDFSRIPVDSEVIKYCKDSLGVLEKDIPRFFSEWGAYSFLGYKLNRIISKTNWIG